jgi:bifunctional DNase/RNase
MNCYHWLAICLLLFPAGGLAAQDAGTVEAKVKTVILDPMTRSPVVVLESLADKRLLPIWIDVPEGRAIALELENVKPPRPLTHDLMRSILDQLGAALERVVITDLRNNTYHALLHLKQRGRELQIDARPSDAMALALRMNAPVFVSSQVFTKAKTVPAVKQPEETHLRLGVQAQDLTPELAAAFGAGVTSGIVVAAVKPGSPAAVAGVQRGDIITKANDAAIKTTSDLENLINRIKTPSKIALEIFTNGEPRTIQIDVPS